MSITGTTSTTRPSSARSCTRTHPDRIDGSEIPVAETPGPYPTVAVLTSHPRWYASVRKRLADVRRREHPSGTRFDTGFLAGTRWEVAVADMGTGNDAATEIIRQAATWLHPQVLLFLGPAGGKEFIRLGDVVVATKVYRYDRHTTAASLPQPASHRLEQAARMALREGSHWCESETGVHFRPIVAVPDERATEARRSGDCLAAEQDALETYQDAVAVELRSTGVACAPPLVGPFGNAPEILTIRGITFTVPPNKQDVSGPYEEVVETTTSAALAVLAELVPWSSVAMASADTADGSPVIRYRDHIDFRNSVFKAPTTGKYVRGEDSTP
ncbi:hypothetical protein [Streptomyces sp. GbtcB6]|uniref:5'-methylthioadenosine/S-adenosylhomocysteine nucleosidase family protein n=1 Tax=Streptomyces sp. GbtcB6 TaxID=2824751 RepID=UPI0020C6F0BB